ncbi:hypothetical protein [Polyangium aurulentum]|uniref:hypothetical protein n=1 Tax=Polyangium aurulentum TaxID=2567896 RepID=UPI0010ADE57A|nr:hypothetical protein [Polyangium aurulentum]UQA55380.1 hypothetical protein E8A73_029020 [Polyangium aurulentum]
MASARQPANVGSLQQENGNTWVSAGGTGGGMGSGTSSTADATGGGRGNDTEGYGVVTGGNTPRVPGEGTGEAVAGADEEWDTGEAALAAEAASDSAGSDEKGAATAGGARTDVTQGGTPNAMIESCVQTCNLFLFMGLQSEPANLYPYGACMSTCAAIE